MAKPNRQIQTDYLRIIAESFDLCVIETAKLAAQRLGLDILDVHDALLCCVAEWSNKIDAQGTTFLATGTTESGVDIQMQIWVDPDRHYCRIEDVCLASGESGDVHNMQTNDNATYGSQS